MADTKGIRAGRAFVELGVSDKLTKGLQAAEKRLKAFGEGKLQETMSAFMRSLPALEQAGYALREFELELGVTPKVIAHFVPTPASEADVAAAREALKDKTIGAAMLGVPRRAS